MNLGMIAVFLVIIIVIGSILTRKCEPFLIGGSIAGAVFFIQTEFSAPMGYNSGKCHDGHNV